MGKEKGILTKEQEKKLAKYLDDVIDFKKLFGKGAGGVIEFFDGKLFLIGITYLDDTLGDKLNVAFKEETKLFAKAIIENNENDIIYYGTNLLNHLVDIPKISEETEAVLMAGILRGLIEAIHIYILRDKS